MIASFSLPKLLGEVASQLAACKKQLDTLPPLVTADPTAFVFNLVVKFCAEVFQHVDGSPAHTKLVQTNKDLYRRFKTSIRSTAPPFVPFTENEAPDNGVSDHIKLDDEADEEGEDNSITSHPTMYLEQVRERIRT